MESEETRPRERGSTDRNRHRVLAVAKALDALDLVIDNPGLTASMVADRLGVKSDTTVRGHLDTAADEGWLIKREGRYFPDPDSPLRGGISASDLIAATLHLLDRLALMPFGATAAELVAGGAIPEDLVARCMLIALNEGWARRDESGRYFYSKGTRDDAGAVDLTIIEPILQRCADLVGGSAFLGTFGPEDSLTVAAHAEAPGVLYLEDIADGLPIAVHSSALGRSLGGTLLSEGLERYIRERGMPRFTNQTVRQYEEYERLVRKGVHERVHTEHGETIPGIHCMAILVRNDRRRTRRYSLAVAQRGDLTKADAERALRVLRDCAVALAQDLIA